MKNYRELIVWQKAMSLVKEVYKIAHLLPKEEVYALSDQMRRSAVSVPSNIAEGFGRDSAREYAHFLSIAKGSLYELDTQIRLALMLGFITNEQSQTAISLDDECCRMLTAMIRKLTN